MAGEVVNSSFVLLSKFVASRQVCASKTATSHTRQTLADILLKQLVSLVAMEYNQTINF